MHMQSYKLFKFFTIVQMYDVIYQFNQQIKRAKILFRAWFIDAIEDTQSQKQHYDERFLDLERQCLLCI